MGTVPAALLPLHDSVARRRDWQTNQSSRRLDRAALIAEYIEAGDGRRPGGKLDKKARSLRRIDEHDRPVGRARPDRDVARLGGNHPLVRALALHPSVSALGMVWREPPLQERFAVLPREVKPVLDDTPVRRLYPV